jgi:hypothetical protein
MFVIINAKIRNVTQVVLHVVKNVKFHVLTLIVHRNAVNHVKSALSHAITNVITLNAKRNALKYVIESHANFPAEKNSIVDTNVLDFVVKNAHRFAEFNSAKITTMTLLKFYLGMNRMTMLNLCF